MRFLRGFLTALLGSVMANLALLGLLRPLVLDPAMPLLILGAGPITVFTLGGAIGATAVYAGMRRLSAAPDRAFILVSALVLVVSFVPDYLIIGQTVGTFAGADWPAALLLMLLHLVEAIIVVWALVRLWGPRMA